MIVFTRSLTAGTRTAARRSITTGLSRGSMKRNRTAAKHPARDNGVINIQQNHVRLSNRRIQTETGTTAKTGSAAEGGVTKNSSWWKRAMMIEQVVPNTGSIARDILAAERTFLAWSRTGLGFVGAGSALFAAYHQEGTTSNKASGRDILPHDANKDDNGKGIVGSASIDSRLEHIHLYPTLAAALLVGNGGFLLAFATRRYLRTVTLMTMKHDSGFFPIDTRGTLLAVAVTATSSVASLGLILANTTRSFSRADPPVDRPER